MGHSSNLDYSNSGLDQVAAGVMMNSYSKLWLTVNMGLLVLFFSLQVGSWSIVVAIGHIANCSRKRRILSVLMLFNK
jgi:hypothetical protein